MKSKLYTVENQNNIYAAKNEMRKQYRSEEKPREHEFKVLKIRDVNVKLREIDIDQIILLVQNCNYKKKTLITVIFVNI